MKVAIVTDSTADIPSDLALKYNINIIPAILVIGDQGLEDGHGISREDLYRQLPAMQTSPSTASPSSGSFQAAYETLLSKGADHVISIHVSSILSSICNAAAVAARAFGDRVHVIDSCHVTLGLGFQVLAAAQAASAGQAINQIQQVIEQIRARIHLVAKWQASKVHYK